MPKRLNASAPGFEAAFQAMLDDQRENDAVVDETVAEIIAGVRRGGDAALLAYASQFDHVKMRAEALRITPEEIAGAVALCPPETLAALDLAARRIEAFHRLQLPINDTHIDAQNVFLGSVWRSIAAVGLYVPGGTAAYPSSVLMNAIPAKVAECGRIVMVTPAPRGQINPLVLAAAQRGGVSEIYRVGGAQAIAALAYGTKTIPAVDKIVGPGNAYVAAAKRQVYGQVGIDTIAGPSEILVVSDAASDPTWIAADLLSQAEHDVAAQSILITDDAGFADRVLAAIDHLLTELPRREIAAASWERHGVIILVASLTDSIPLIDRIAPEHLELAIDHADVMAARVRNAGAMFLGRYTPEAIGDYVGGPNHVLPTGRSARFSSGLGVQDFMKRSSILRCDRDSIRSIGPAGHTLAMAEGLDAHALSIQLRLAGN